MRLLALALLLHLTVPPLAAQSPTYDLVIRNGRIIDGTGSPWYSGDLGIRGGRIAAIGRLEGAKAKQTVDARGEVVAPGFIDMLGQSELAILVDPRLPSKIFQGITTEITGEGGSPAPLNDAIIAADRAGYDQLGIDPDWRTLAEYYARLERQGIGINIATYVGATQVRRMVLGDDDKDPTAAQLQQMRALVRQAMLDGAVGLSTSLQYPPAPYAETPELIALATEAAGLGGLYATHLRNESDEIIPALDEAIRIGREARIPVEVWHLKTAGKNNWGRMPEVVARINSARKAGVDIAADTYAYPAWFNSLSSFVPPWAHDGGTARLLERLRDPKARERIRQDMESPNAGWDNSWQKIEGPQAILIGAVHDPALRKYQGKTLADVAQDRGGDAIEALLDFLIEDDGYTFVAVFGMSEPDVALALEQPWVSINCDSEGAAPEGILSKSHPHPRAYGTFPRILRKYVREEQRLTLEDAIRKFTSLAAQRMRLADRGVLKVGMWADVVVFDPATVRDRATFAQPHQLAEGMRWVLVNGVPVIAEGKATGARPGKVLRGAVGRSGGQAVGW
ncbi:MAG TPA: D-aminoacylase [Gemmatimonadales bacterium]|nr:D-aminoacylase [Gemmatimonadales bacterium]